MSYRARKATQCGACNRWVVALSNHRKTKVHATNLAAIKARNSEAGINFPRGKLNLEKLDILDMTGEVFINLEQWSTNAKSSPAQAVKSVSMPTDLRSTA
jgi:hypothetical protein